MSKKDNKTIGNIGEQIALKYLENCGYQIIETNFRYKKYGELDIIAKEKEFYCFIEVKTRTSTTFGLPSESVSLKKQEKIRTIAQIFLNQRKIYNINIRFDVIEIIVDMRHESIIAKYTNLIRNAF